MRPLISAIIPTHNRAGLLKEALESVLAQQGINEEFDIEVIVVDDASSDTTSEVVTNYPTVHYIRLPMNRGLAAARNTGVKASSGEYVAFLDDDDIWLPNKLKQQIPPLGIHPEVAAIYSPCILRLAGQEKVIPDMDRAPSGFVLKFLVQANLAPVHGYLLRRSAIERGGYFDEQLPCLEDWDLWLRIALHSPFIFLPGCVGVYRCSPHGMLETAKTKGIDQGAYRHILEKLRNLLKDSTVPKEVIEEGGAWVELQLASVLATEQTALAQSHLLAAIRMFPDLIREAETRQKIARVVSEIACHSAAVPETRQKIVRIVSEIACHSAAVPLSFTRTLNDEIRRCTRPVGSGQWITITRLFSDVWAEYLLTARPVPQSNMHPVVSIVIPVHNNLGYTRSCIEALVRNTPKNLPYELVIVDNGSMDGTNAYLRSMGGQVRVLRNDSNLGFARACNQGAAAALGDFLVFLNNDTIPHDGWLTGLLDAIHSDPSIAVVGSKLLYPDGRIQHVGVAFGPPPDGVHPWHIYRGERADAPHVNKQRDFQAVTAACMLVRKRVFFELGGFDEAFVNGYEDVDFCLRVRERQYRIVYAPGSVLTHYESKTPGRFLHEEENVKLLNKLWEGRILPDYRYHFETVGQEVPWPFIAREAQFYYAQGRVEEGDASIAGLLTSMSGKRIRFKQIDLSRFILAKVAESRLAKAIETWPREKRSDLQCEFSLGLAYAYYKIDKRSASRHYLCNALLCRPSLLLRPECLFLVLKVAVPLGLLQVARVTRNKSRVLLRQWDTPRISKRVRSRIRAAEARVRKLIRLRVLGPLRGGID